MATQVGADSLTSLTNTSPPLISSKLMQKALIFVGKNIAAGALSYVGGQAAGYVLAEIFGTEGPTNQEMLDAINALGQELTGIEDTLAEIQADLDENFAEIEQMLTKIDQQARYIAWQQVNDEVVNYVSQTQTQYSTYVEYAVAAATTSKQEVRSLVQQIQDTNVGAKVSLYGINSFVLAATRPRVFWSCGGR